MSHSTPYRLVWFQHIHKSAGTSIVDWARANGESLWPGHKNGNPVDEAGAEIPLGHYTATQLLQFVDECERRNITFVATEWRLPDVDVLSADPRVALITCLRDPLQRFWSNYYFDLYIGYTKARSPRDFLGSRPRSFVYPDYYCRLFSRVDVSPGPVTPVQESEAWANLRKFDCALVLGNGMDHLGPALGWSAAPSHSNRSDFDWRWTLGLLRRGRFGLASRRYFHPKRPPDAEFRAWFEERNAADRRLFDAVARQGGWGRRPADTDPAAGPGAP